MCVLRGITDSILFRKWYPWTHSIELFCHWQTATRSHSERSGLSYDRGITTVLCEESCMIRKTEGPLILLKENECYHWKQESGIKAFRLFLFRQSGSPHRLAQCLEWRSTKFVEFVSWKNKTCLGFPKKTVWRFKDKKPRLKRIEHFPVSYSLGNCIPNVWEETDSWARVCNHEGFSWASKWWGKWNLRAKSWLKVYHIIYLHPSKL